VGRDVEVCFAANDVEECEETVQSVYVVCEG
jgi:hypothetical protein